MNAGVPPPGEASVGLSPIWILTFGSLGDVLPLAALGSELARRGHAVTLWCGALHRPMVERMGLEAVTLETDAMPDLSLHAKGLHKTPQMWRRVEQSTRAAYADLVSRWHDRPAHAPRPLVVASTFALAGRLAQERLGLPLVTVHLSPLCMVSFRDLPALKALPYPERVPAWAGAWLGPWVERLVFDPVVTRDLNVLRAELGLPPVRHLLSRWMHSPERVLGLFPDWFGSPQPDWPAAARVLGFPQVDGSGEAAMATVDPELERFLADGPPPVVCYPGSARRNAQKFFDEALRTAQHCGLRVVLLTRYPDQVKGCDDLPPWALYRRYVPLSALLPRAAALVHCGGVGTLAQAVAAGCPQLVLPNHFDQFDNARRVQRLRLGHRHSGSEWGGALQALLADRGVLEACLARRSTLRSGVEVLAQAADLVLGHADRAAVAVGQA